VATSKTIATLHTGVAISALVPQAVLKGISNGDLIGVYGSSVNAPGVFAVGDRAAALVAVGTEEAGVYATSVRGIGLVVDSDNNVALEATSPRLGREAIKATSHNHSAALLAHNLAGGLAGKFEGNVRVDGQIATTGDVSFGDPGFGITATVNGDLRVVGQITATVDIVLEGADCAEEFDIAGTERVEPGTVMVLDPQGALTACAVAYDKCAAGVVSGAGSYRPGLVLDRQASGGNRLPIALLGKVFCKVDADASPIEIGDLLTTSSTPGHAMKASDRERAFGTVIGKALRPLASGRGLIPVLVAMQ
jgi:hypothetical protein